MMKRNEQSGLHSVAGIKVKKRPPGDLVVWVASILFVVSLVAFIELVPDVWCKDSRGILLMLSVVAVPALLIRYSSKANQKYYKPIVAELLNRPNRDSLLHLIELLDTPGVHSYMQVIHNKIVASLWQLRREDTLQWSNRQWNVLYKRLLSNDEALVLAVINLIQLDETANALPHIKMLVQKKGVARRNEAVFQAAQDCEEMLQSKLNRQNAPETLLRPSAPASNSEFLLRTVRGATEMQPENNMQLLRPVAGQDDTPHV